jgi:hypothetical protein
VVCEGAENQVETGSPDYFLACAGWTVRIASWRGAKEAMAASGDRHSIHSGRLADVAARCIYSYGRRCRSVVLAQPTRLIHSPKCSLPCELVA